LNQATRPAGAGYALAVLFFINLMNFFDRQILGAVGEDVRREWSLSDTALGLLGTAFTLLYAVVGVPLGRLADRGERRKILGAGVFVWSLLTAVSGFARTFSQMVIARLGVGIGEATCSPASTSLIGDLFPGTRRARAVAIWMLGLPLGLGLANGTGGWIAQHWGWRSAFYLAAIPGILCALAALFIKEPARGMLEQHAVGERRRPGSPYKLVLSIPTLWWIIASGALHNFNMYALGAFLVPFLIRFHGTNTRDGGHDLDGGLRPVGNGRPLRRRRGGRRAVQAPHRRPPAGVGRGARDRDAADVPGAAAAARQRARLLAADGLRDRRDVRVLRDRVHLDPRRRRAVVARHGDGALLLRDVPARRVARAARHRRRERLFHDEGRRRGGRGGGALAGLGDARRAADDRRRPEESWRPRRSTLTGRRA
jgi:hypothetical protein